VSIELRPIGATDWEDYTRANAAAFGWEPNSEQLAEVEQIFEFDRTLAAIDGDEIVGTTSIYSFDLTVPGGVLPTAGVTWVSVKPTHRRQGILRAIMQRQLNDVHERNEPLAALWASESVIYGRFGYGLAAQNVEFTIDRLRTSLARQAPSCGRLRLVTREQALEAWPAVYEEVRARQPGFYTRTKKWWAHQSMRGPDMERRAGVRFNVQYEEEGRVLGYARYRIRGEGGTEGPSGTLTVWDLTAASENAYTALWQYLFGVDLIGTITAMNRPIDEPLYWMLADPRRLVRRPYDSLWVRLVDVPPALEGRRYGAAGRVVFDLRDPFCPWNEGRYELEAGVEGARCRRTDATPEITLGAADLAAVYLGGGRLTTLRLAGRVEGDWETLRRADAIFSWDPLPWCPEVF
jgi:predicted acetyltransferase